ncbi:lipopolysaccharide assembly protein LapB [Candidatus Vallotia cooleyia]|uniref:lipopolysaccharide assembly protein LapB n=1 Tax=Candidatus Vallotiella adelgis TaxID=1177211 RepID=UPI001D00E2DD|nr:lipopolysaccharide assembly protein LapB [Candidatus Vallotia cooleyia]UDG82073.1 Lipopolysaccharide assembly protein B [Candidatus Vallotia cooleyia]
MAFDLWWLLITLIVFGLGWCMGHHDPKNPLPESKNLPRSYFQGLNFLLNEQPDQAIDAFIEVAKLDPETTELHFALGTLFRRRGETDRAIRVHQNLLSREDLPSNELDHALYELGQDFLKAGLLDRAEETFQRLHSGDYTLGALQALLAIFEIERDWYKAIEVAQRIEVMGVLSLVKQISQFHCELAQEALQHNQIDDARKSLQQALKYNPQNVRATLLSGDIEMACNKPTQALKRWQQVEKQNPAYLPLVAHKLMQAYAQTGQALQGAALLMRYIQAYPSNDLLDDAYKHIAELRGVDAAHALARTQMDRSPNLAGMTRLLDAQIAVAEEPHKGELELTSAWIQQRTKNLLRYACQNCGFRARLFYWQCPGCSGWETYAPWRVEPITSAN